MLIAGCSWGSPVHASRDIGHERRTLGLCDFSLDEEDDDEKSMLVRSKWDIIESRRSVVVDFSFSSLGMLLAILARERPGSRLA